MFQLQKKAGVYLDHNATTPPSTRILKKLPDWLQAWGNPSSVHWAGREPKALLRDARTQVARFIGANPLEVIFTSCGTESNNLVLKGVFDQAHPAGRAETGRTEIIVSGVEHPALMKAALDLEARGARVHIVRVTRDGEVDLNAFEKLLSSRTLLVSIMLANNETGCVLPVKKMAKLAHQAGALFHTDATQALGKTLVNVGDLGVDFATFSGHKFYALRGVGVLVARKGVSLHTQLLGGGQERHRRAGTENILAIASLGEMCSTPQAELESAIENMARLRDLMEARMLREIPDVVINGARGIRLPNTSSTTLAGVDGESLLMSLDMKGFAVSTGAACSSGSAEPSPVLRAMGLSLSEAQSSLRVSLGWGTQEEEIKLFVDGLREVVGRLRSNRMRVGESYGI